MQQTSARRLRDAIVTASKTFTLAGHLGLPYRLRLPFSLYLLSKACAGHNIKVKMVYIRKIVCAAVRLIIDMHKLGWIVSAGICIAV